MNVQSVSLALQIGDRVSPVAGVLRGDLGYVYGFTRRNRQLHARVAFALKRLAAIPVTQLRKA